MSDAGQPCNGGDARIDIYSARMRPGKVAQVLPYLPGADARPGWMFVNPALAGSATDVRDIFAHESPTSRSSLYDRYAINPSVALNLEHIRLGRRRPRPPGPHPRLSTNDNATQWRFEPSAPPRAWPSPLGEAADVRDENGYRDWLFFLFLTKKAGSTAPITSTFNATETLASIPALNQGLGGQFIHEVEGLRPRADEPRGPQRLLAMGRHRRTSSRWAPPSRSAISSCRWA